MLFKTSDRLIEYAELTQVNFTSVKATIAMVEVKYLVPVLGKELYDNLNEDYNDAAAETDLGDADLELLDACRKVIGPMVCYHFAFKADVKLSDGGVRREETGAMKTAFQYQTSNYREENLREGEAAIENLLKYLEDNKADLPEWTESVAFKQYRRLFIKTGNEFSELFSSHSPQRNYWAMRSKMYDVEENNIRPALGSVLYDALKEKDHSATGSFTDKEKVLLEKLKSAIAYLTVAYAIPFLNVRIDANGLTVQTLNARSTDDAKSARSNASDTALSKMIGSCLDAGQAWLKNATDYMKANASDFGITVVLANDDCRLAGDDCSELNPRYKRYHRDGGKGSFGMA